MGGGEWRERENFLFPMQEMGAKTQFAGFVSIVLYFTGMEESKSPEV
jgi:hypothetical protein